MTNARGVMLDMDNQTTSTACAADAVERKKERIAKEARSTWPPLRQRIATIIESRNYEFPVAAVILINAFLVILDVDSRAGGGEQPQWIGHTMNLFLVFYICDIGLRLWAFRGTYWQSSLNNFDFVVICVTVIFEILGIMAIEVGLSVSVLRVLRLGRLLRFVKLVQAFHELYVMVHLMMSALRAITWGAVLMAVMLTIWSVVAVEVLDPLNRDIAENTDAYDGCDRCERAFSSVSQSNLTFFQQIIAGDSWGQVSVVMIENYPATAILLVLVVLSVDLGLMNLVVTVIVDKAQEARERNVAMSLQETMEKFDQAKEMLMEICQSLDGDGSGELSLEELEAGYDSNKTFAEMLNLMDVTRKDLKLLVSVMDEDKSGQVSYAEFCDNLWQIKNTSTHSTCVFIKFHVQQLTNMQREVLEYHQKVAKSLSKIDRKISSIEEFQASFKETPPNDGASETSHEHIDVPRKPERSRSSPPRPTRILKAEEDDNERREIFNALRLQGEQLLAMETRNSELLARLGESVMQASGHPSTQPFGNTSTVPSTWRSGSSLPSPTFSMCFPEKKKDHGGFTVQQLDILLAGKYRGRTYHDVLTQDPDYCQWVVQLSCAPDAQPWLKSFAQYLNSQGVQALDRNPVSSSAHHRIL